MSVEWEYPPGSGRRASYSPAEAAEMRDLMRRKADGEIDTGEFNAIVGLIHDAKVDADAKVLAAPADEVEPPVEYEPSELFPIPEGIKQRLADRTPPEEPPPGDSGDEAPLSDPDENTIGKFNNPATSGAPDTQRKAAIELYPQSGTQRRQVLDAIGKADDRGATDAELEQILAGLHQGVSARRNELMNGGWVCESGRSRKTPSGRDAAVWILTERGRREWKPAQD